MYFPWYGQTASKFSKFLLKKQQPKQLLAESLVSPHYSLGIHNKIFAYLLLKTIISILTAPLPLN